MAESVTCAKLPKLQGIPNITLLGGAEIKAFADFSQGMPTDCKLTFNLLLQLSPLLASMACLLKILNVIGKLQAFVEAAKPPFTDLPGTIPDLLAAIGALKDCIPALAIPQIVFMLKGMLQLIVNFLDCFISQLDSIVKFQASIDLTQAEGNPVLRESLLCARDNAQASMDNLMLSLQPVQPILSMVTNVASIAGQSISLPDLSGVGGGADPAQVVTSLRDAIASLKNVIASLPG